LPDRRPTDRRSKAIHNRGNNIQSRSQEDATLAEQTQPLEQRYQDILQAQTITEDSPGTILKDFATLLDFIGSEDMETSGKYHFLPMRLLSKLNARLSKPVVLDFKRPQQKSYPPIHGLYLLLRASGLAYVQQRGKKSYLQLDEQGLASWHSLNPTERYFTLLESWLVRGDPQILGERGYFASGGIRNWPIFFQRFPGRSLQVAGNQKVESLLPYEPSLCTLALLELFGIVTLRHAKPEPGKGWRIDRIERTEFGDAMTRVLFGKELISQVLFAEPEDQSADILHTRFAPFFPEWRHHLVLSEPEKLEGIYVFKVSLGSVWARIAIPSDGLLEDLSASILNAYQFDFDHLYCFTYVNRFGIAGHVNHPDMDEPLWADEVTIDDLGLTPGMVMTYRYDFGDNWQFQVLLERVEPPDSTVKQAKLLDLHGKPPSQYGDDDDNGWWD